MEFVELLKTYNAGDIAFIKSILDSEQVEYHIRGENFNAVDPLIQPVTFFVRENMRKTAMELLDGLDIQFLGLKTDD